MRSLHIVDDTLPETRARIVGSQSIVDGEVRILRLGLSSTASGVNGSRDRPKGEERSVTKELERVKKRERELQRGGERLVNAELSAQPNRVRLPEEERHCGKRVRRRRRAR